ncbi:MAG: aspartyl protease family protein [Planctomycetes bacterium]|nr:aspartyl protease family protein [Planctomycetota bacterium]
MQISSLLVLVSFVWMPLNAMAVEDSSSLPAPPKKSELTGSKVSVPMDLDSPRPIISAKINGKGPFQLIFDTGCDGMVVMKGLASQLNLPVTGKAHMGDPSNPKAIEVDRVSIQELTIGGATFRDLEADSWDAPPGFLHGMNDVRGIIGLPVFSQFLVTFDYANGRMTLERGALPEADGGEVLDYETKDGGSIPLIPLSVGGVAMRAHIDSGAPGEITLPENIQSRLKLMGNPVVVGHARTVNSEFDILAATLDGDLRIGRHVFERPSLKFIDMLNDAGVGNIGSALLRQFHVTFDQKNKRIRFANRTKTASAAPSHIGHHLGG